MGGKYLLVTAFLSGMSIMAVEMSSSRLLAPYFGTSLFVWTNIIGIIMLALSIGYWFGGRIADKYPSENVLFSLIVISGFYIGFIPFYAKPVMQLAVLGINNSSISLFYVSLLVTLLIFALPLAVLGMVSPFIIRLCSKDVRHSGEIAGNVYSVSTIGSILGTFIPALLTIPFIGTNKTIFLFSLVLVLIGLVGLRKKLLVFMPVVLLFLFLNVGVIKAESGLIHEEESAYNYIQVIEDSSGVRYLKLNEGNAYHSVYDPSTLLSTKYFSYFGVLPSVNGGEEVLMIGHAAGTISNIYSFYYPYLHIDGVEIDSRISEVGREYFHMDESIVDVYNMDGRTFLYANPSKRYDLVIIDAYKQPYIPFHLTTKEFFVEVKEHLEVGGIVGFNIGAVNSDVKVLKMILNTIADSFLHVYVVKIPNSFNFIVFASDSEYDYTDVEGLEPPLYKVGKEITLHIDRYHGGSEGILTDDKAPVEVLTDWMIYEYAS